MDLGGFLLVSTMKLAVLPWQSLNYSVSENEKMWLIITI